MKRIIALVACWVAGSSLFAAITITPASRTFDKDGGGGAILTAGSGTWTASTTADWITITPAKTGNAGESVVYIVNSNFSADTRVGTITVSGNTHTITQTGYDASINPVSATFDLEGGSGELEVTTLSGVSWTARSNASWITLTSTMGLGSGSLSYEVAANSSVTTRTGTITVAGQTYSITQTGVDVTLSPEATYLESSADIVLLTITALNTTAWTVEPCSPWISVVSGGSGYGGGSATLAVAANPSWLERTGTVKVGSATLTIRQKGTKDLSFAITPETATAESDGAYGNVAVIATPDAPWTAESEASWITLSSGQSGAGNGNIQYVVSPNTTLSQRTGTIKVTPPVVVPDVDLYRGLLFWIKDQKNIEGNEERKTTYALSKVFDGSFNNQLTGADIPAFGNCGYTLSFSFKVGQLNCVNRLLQLKSHSLFLNEQNRFAYHKQNTSFYVDEPNVYYTVVVAVDDQQRLKVYAGKRNSQLTCVRELRVITGSLDFNAAAAMSIFNFGYCTYPSTGNLQSGQLANIRFWTRALTDRECECVDTKQNAAKAGDNKPMGVAEGIGWNYFPLDGNAYSTTHTSDVPAVRRTSVSGCVAENDQYERTCSSLGGSGSGLIRITNFETLFSGSCIVNNGVDLGISSGHYGVHPNGSAVYLPYETTVVKGSEEDATYAFWMKVKALPTSGRVTVFNRSVTNYKNSLVAGGGLKDYIEVFPAANNKALKLELTSAAQLVLSGTGMESTTFKNVLECGKWYYVVTVGRSGKLITVYLDGVEIGNVPTPATLGYLPKVDGRYVGHSPLNGIYEVMFGEVVAPDAIFTLGGWNGCVDGLSFIHGALTTSQVRELYAEQVRKYVYHTVTQGAASPSFDKTTVRLPANGGVASVGMTLAAGVNWTAKSNNAWLTIANGTSGTGSATITFSAGANPSVYEREGSLTVAGRTVSVIQEGLNAAVSYDEEIVYGADGGSGNVSVMAEANGSWTAVSDVDWITVALGASGSGNGTVMYVVAPYNNTTAARIGTLTIAGKKVYITQRGYAMSIDPYVAQIGGNSGSGSVAVSAPVGAIWEAIAKEPWITITGGQSGSGSGTLTYAVKENTTGAVRTGTIIIAGEAYKITQMYRVVMSVGVEGRGSVTGAGNYDYGADVTLTATPDAGYQFSHWSGVATGTDNPVTIKIDEACKATAHFTPIAPVASATKEEKDGVVVSWGALAWADQYRVYRAEANEKPDVAAATVDKETLVWNDTTAFPGKTYYYWVEAIGSEEQTVSASVTGSRAVSLASVAISCVGELFAEDSTSCSCTAAYNDGTSKGVTPSWSVEGTSATVDKSGELTAGAVEADSVVTVRASFTEDGITKTASAQVAICPKVALDEAATGISSMTTGGNGTWFGQKKESCGGEAALRSPRVASGVSAWVGCSVTGAGTLTFKWRKEGANAGKLSLAVNGGEVAVYGEASDSWASVTKEFYDSADKDFKWIYAGGENVEAHGLVAEIAWTPGTAITVNFNANGGSGSMTGMTFLQGADKNLPANAFTRTGYAFAGWATSVGGEVVYADGASVEDMTSGGGGAVTLYAKWTANSYTVKFNANGGTGTMANEPMTYDVTKALTACAFTRKGYMFAGWAREAATGMSPPQLADGAVVKNLATSGTVTLYAKWTPNNYVIDFNPGQGGTGTMPDQPMTYDEEEALYANLFARTGYTFLGWTDDESELEEVLFYDGVVVSNLTDEVDGEFDLYAVWAANEYTVRFNANGGEGAMAEMGFLYDEAQSLPMNAFTRTGYTFAGWAREAATGMSPPQLADAEVVSNLTAEADGVVTLYAVWTANPYTIRFNANGGEGSMTDIGCVYGAERSLTVNAFTRKGYAFAGWATSEKGPVVYADGASVTSLTAEANGVVTLYAVWQAGANAVSFDGNGGTPSEASRSVLTDAQVGALPSATRTGWTLVGWFTAASGGTQVSADTVITAAVTFFAQWTANEYAVKFDANGGSGTMADEPMTYDAEKALTACAFTRKGYTFAGWAREAATGMSPPQLADGAVVSNLTAEANGVVTLYARWEEIVEPVVTNAITYLNLEGAANSNPTTFTTNDLPLVLGPVEREGWTFLGWTPDGGVIPAGTMTNMTFAAQWEKLTGEVAISSVEAQQRYPWNGLVDITVTIQGSAEDVAKVECVFAATNSATKAAIPVEHITRNGDDEASDGAVTRKFIWDATADVGAVKIDDVALMVGAVKLGGVQLWENGPYWAECNVGATKPEEYGYYFWWGDTVGYKRNANDNGWISVKDSTEFLFSSGNCPTSGKDNSQLQSAGYIDATGNLVAAHDAATVHLGASWRMPTDAELSALISNCTATWTTRNGVSGQRVAGRGAYSSKSIFLPAAGGGVGDGIFDCEGDGNYWSATPFSDTYDYARDLAWGVIISNGQSCPWQVNFARYTARSVRPVREFANAGGIEVASANAVTTHLSLDTHTGTRELSSESVDIRYVASWYENGALARVEDNGMVVASGVSGDFAWLPTDGGAHTLKLSVFDGADSLVGSETAEFVVLGCKSITYVNLHGTTHSNPETYLEGTAVTFTPPSERAGYTFTGWIPAAITAEIRGSQTVTAGWRANAYQIAYDANGGLGVMADEPMTYDAEKALTACAFTKKGYTFAGWATSAGGAVKYANGATVKNLTATAGGTVTLYAKWTPNSYVIDFNPGQGGEGTMSDQPMTYDEEAALYANLFARTGYTFLGWTDDESELEEVLFYDGVVVSNLTDEVDGEYDLYAVWAANEYAVRFNANGGEGTMSEMGFLYDEAQSLPMNAFVRTGYTFVGWTRDAATGMSPPQLADAEIVSNLTAAADGVVTLYAVWTANPYTIRFNANGGEGSMTDQAFLYDEVQALRANAFTRTGYAFAGWACDAATGMSPPQLADAEIVSNLTAEANGVVTLYAVWQAGTNAVSFDGNGGTPSEASRSVLTDAKVGALPSATRTGWTLVGWFTAASGGTQVSADTVITAAVTFFAQWTANEYAVKFDANGGEGTMADQTFLYDEAQALPMNAFVRTGHAFAGWAREAATGMSPPQLTDGAVVSNLTAEADGVVTLYAVWDNTGLLDEDEAHVDVAKGEVVPYEDAAVVYDGYMYDGETVVGSVQVKVARGKVDKKSGEFSAKVTATVQMAGQAKKLSFKGGVADEKGAVTRMSVAEHELDVTVGVKGLGGTFDGKYKIDGARNVFSGKSTADKTAAGEAARLYQGVYNVAFDGGTLSVSVDKKGKAKIAGTVEGNKVSATSQLVVGKDAAVVPVVIVKKVEVAFCLWVMADGTVEVRGADSVTSGRDSASPFWVAGKAGTLKVGAKFGVDEATVGKLKEWFTELYADYLPKGVAVAQEGKRWIVADGAKAGKLVLDKTTGSLNREKSKFTDNMAGLKLSYKEKDGTFKGSFKAYNLENGKIKSYSASVTGVMIGTKGYGTATIKKPACTFPVTIE